MIKLITIFIKIEFYLICKNIRSIFKIFKTRIIKIIIISINSI